MITLPKKDVDALRDAAWVLGIDVALEDKKLREAYSDEIKAIWEFNGKHWHLFRKENETLDEKFKELIKMLKDQKIIQGEVKND